VYAGHAAIALLVKGVRPRIPLAVLVPVAFAPDWIEWVSEALGHHNRNISHSLVSVALGATLVGLVYWAVRRAPADAVAVALTYASHWPADFITGVKPTWPGGPQVGLLLYMHPIADVLLESAVIVLCSVIYLRSLPPSTRRRPPGLLIPVGLIAMQIGFAAIQNPVIKEPLRDMTTRLYP
jgi:membrane-bound metal-dependent hydrolase YbcI (DUF457 family)